MGANTHKRKKQPIGLLIELIAPPFVKGRGWGGNVNVGWENTPANEKSSPSDCFSFVGVDGFEPPTLCL